MKNLRRDFSRFCYKHQNKGISNLMLYIALGNAVVYLLSYIGNTNILYKLLCFDRDLILQGQIWRLVTYAFTYHSGNILFTALILYILYSLGRAAELSVGTFRFNLYYLSGIILQDIFCMILGTPATISDLNFTIIMVFASQHPDFKVNLYFVIPIKAWILVLIDLGITAYNIIALRMFFPHNLFPLVAILNFFLFFGADVLNVIPQSWRLKIRRLFNKNYKSTPQRPKVVPFARPAANEQNTAQSQAPYTHKCTVCGRTDASHPELEFRYCSRCSGYHCYCEDHISNHTHIE
jgi:hypothetical protein